ncbi:hypothetical protein [Halobaculum magnesiiphilum]|uniref:DUF8151 domain-containing protein n=1 Tax=Halobaculum magnesiiphilum TaxID=1017351 RepID=A0A8T8WHN5_9EURY|nr:hypothetical protein [Halobaculum magnesiiphilum]QZP39263.1 hypothetical protein K6T50_16550 [Halobaculum magnesiiphilum]
MDSALEILPELLELVVFGLGSAGLSVAGLYIEQFALTTAQSGQTLLAGWAAVIGCVVLVFAYLLATDKAAKSYVKVKRELAEG